MMQKLLRVVLLTCTCVCTYAQDITGDWNAVLNAGGQELPLIFHINKADSTYTATLDSPKQRAIGLEVNTVTYENKQLSLSLVRLGITYEGTVQDDGMITGTFQQNGFEMPLNLSRGEAKAVEQLRPQEPKGPYPYRVEGVNFDNEGAGVTLAGTLTLPKVIMRGKHKLPAVILITGSGPQNRDEELLGHKPFLVLADYLTRQGIAVLRYDDRGTAASTGDFAAATSADFATDVQAAFEFLKTHPDIDPSKIGLAGHSEGGLIAPIVAAGNKEVAFIALLAGVGQPGSDLLVEQGYLIGKAQGMDEEQLQNNRIASAHVFDLIKTHYGDAPKIKSEVTTYLKTVLAENPEAIPAGSSVDEVIEQQVGTITTDWFQYLIVTDPRPTLEKVQCPVLAINGSLDLQVPAKQNLDGISEALKKGGNKAVRIVEIPNLNHLFQTTETGNPTEYGIIEETFSPKALRVIGDWIVEITK